MLRKQEIRMKEQEKKKKGNLWLTVATFIVNKRKAIEILFVLAIIYSVLCINKVQVNQDITSYPYRICKIPQDISDKRND